MNIYGQNAIIYNLTDIAQSSIGNLAGKTIEIEFEDIQELINTGGSVIAELGAVDGNRFILFTKGTDTNITVNKFRCFKRNSGNETADVCINFNNTLQNNTLSFTVPDGTYFSLQIGNNDKFDRPINTHIKSVRILE